MDTICPENHPATVSCEAVAEDRLSVLKLFNVHVAISGGPGRVASSLASPPIVGCPLTPRWRPLDMLKLAQKRTFWAEIS